MEIASRFSEAAGDVCPHCRNSGENFGKVGEGFFCLRCGTVFVPLAVRKTWKKELPKLVEAHRKRILKEVEDLCKAEGGSVKHLAEKFGTNEGYMKSLLNEAGYTDVCDVPGCGMPCKGRLGLLSHKRHRHGAMETEQAGTNEC